MSFKQLNNTGSNEVVLYQASIVNRLATISAALVIAVCIAVGYNLASVDTTPITSEVSGVISNARNNAAWTMLSDSGKQAISKLSENNVQLREQNAELKQMLSVKEAELAKVELKLAAASNSNEKLQEKLSNALIAESSVTEAVKVHVVEPTTSAVKEGYYKAKDFWNSYEFKPEKVTNLWNGK